MFPKSVEINANYVAMVILVRFLHRETLSQKYWVKALKSYRKALKQKNW